VNKNVVICHPSVTFTVAYRDWMGADIVHLRSCPLWGIYYVDRETADRWIQRDKELLDGKDDPRKALD